MAIEDISASRPRVSPPVYPLAGNRLSRAVGRGLGRLLYRAMGWTLAGELPARSKVIIVGGPHTSNWDLALAMGAMLQMGLRFSWMMKREAFVWPLGPVWRALGGIPIDRSQARSVPEQMAAWFDSVEAGYLGITPEGTRASVIRYKRGYLRIAYASQVPVFVVGIDSRDKTVHLDRLWPLTGDIEADNAAIRDYVRTHYTGVRPEND